MHYAYIVPNSCSRIGLETVVGRRRACTVCVTLFFALKRNAYIMNALNP